MQNSNDDREDKKEEAKAGIIASGEALENTSAEQNHEDPTKELHRVMGVLTASHRPKEKMTAVAADCQAFDKGLDDWRDEFHAQGKP
ncbi:hypothetical protein FRB94_002379 [Tulasnella sp. JGI-2019a]|nr:hypothetical protein FRB93_004404 [Tulasnella sp. JGI-2019a]KAG9004434.1 hypothetical protein FRB94_002379 [Tulasnella sp. JGI-2019a]